MNGFTAIGKYLPGAKTIVKNIPAGHIPGVNDLYVAKPNGLTIGIFSPSTISGQLVGQKGVKYDLRKMSWLGSCSSDVRTLVVGKHTFYKSLEGLAESKETIKFGVTAVGGRPYVDAIISKMALGASNWKVITGYKGGDVELAIMRKEIDATFGGWGSMRSFVESGEARVLMFISDKPVKDYEHSPLLENFSTEEHKPAVKLQAFLGRFDRCWAGPPGIPANRLKILREAFKSSWYDTDLLKRAKKLGRSVDYMSGEEASILIMESLEQPPATVKLMKSLILVLAQ